MRFGGTFSGIGGIELGFGAASYELPWMIEENIYRRRLLKQRFTSSTVLPDIQSWDAYLYCNEINFVDIIGGGFPCQDVSVGGNRGGLSYGKKSSLWFYQKEIIRNLRPHYALVENVPGLRSEGMSEVLGDLAACGYDAQWASIPAATFGAPHRRDRIWIVAYQPTRAWQQLSIEHKRFMADARSQLACAKVLTGSLASSLANWQEGGNTTSNSSIAVPEQVFSSNPQTIFSPHALSAYAKAISSRQWRVEPTVDRVVNGVPVRLDRLRALGDAVVPWCAHFIALRILVHATQGG